MPRVSSVLRSREVAAGVCAEVPAGVLGGAAAVAGLKGKPAVALAGLNILWAFPSPP